MNGMMNGSGMGGGFFGFGLVILIVVVAIISIVVWMMKPNKNERSSQQDSIERLNHRLANGDISEEEYDRLKKKIEH
ncbi:Vpu [Halobacillus litoralis]|uniref:Vpu n=1 Tax=Halobacillus litoralis TaxID=45668 RepID=UPI001CFDE649|nr:SHOCT domain-containing protein [Halobacillus litoralis]